MIHDDCPKIREEIENIQLKLIEEKLGKVENHTEEQKVKNSAKKSKYKEEEKKVDNTKIELQNKRTKTEKTVNSSTLDSFHVSKHMVLTKSGECIIPPGLIFYLK